MTSSTFTRRDVLKVSSLASLASLAAITPILFSIRSNANESSSGKSTYDSLLKGVSDLHIHASPDSTERKMSELEISREAKKAGYRALLFKSNDFSSHDRAFIIREVVKDLEVFGGLCLNKVFGEKVNPYAVRKAIQTTGNYCKCVWLPTLDAAYQQKKLNTGKKGIAVTDGRGKVLPEVIEVMEICAEANIVLASGHSSPEEVRILAKKAKEVGLQKFVATHVNSGIWQISRDQTLKLIDFGAYVELCFITTLWGPGTGIPNQQKMSTDEFAKLTLIAPERSFITTDLGQVKMPDPLDGMLMCIKALQKANVPSSAIDLLVKRNPALLMGLT